MSKIQADSGSGNEESPVPLGLVVSPEGEDGSVPVKKLLSGLRATE